MKKTKKIKSIAVIIATLLVLFLVPSFTVGCMIERPLFSGESEVPIRVLNRDATPNREQIRAGAFILISRTQNGVNQGFYQVASVAHPRPNSADVLYSGTFSGRTVLHLDPGEWLTFRSVDVWCSSNAPRVNQNALEWHGSRYEIGQDLLPGEYLLTANIPGYAMARVSSRPAFRREDTRFLFQETIFNCNMNNCEHENCSPNRTHRVFVQNRMFLTFSGATLRRIGSRTGTVVTPSLLAELNRTITQVEADIAARDMEIYTQVSVERLNSALSTARNNVSRAMNVAELINVTHGTLQGNLESILAALNGLTERPPPPDFYYLQKEYDRILEYIDEYEDLYTPNSVATVRWALDNARTILDNDETPQSDIDDALENLLNAESELVLRVDDPAYIARQLLIPEIQRVEEHMSNFGANYTPATVTPITAALFLARLARDNPDSSVITLNDNRVGLTAAFRSRVRIDGQPVDREVDVAELRQLIDEITEFRNLYILFFTPQSGVNINAALIAANITYNNFGLEQDDIDAEVVRLQAAFDTRELIEPAGDRQPLIDLIDEVDLYIEAGDFTPAQLILINLALASARQSAGIQFSTQARLDDDFNRLTEAFIALKGLST